MMAKQKSGSDKMNIYGVWSQEAEEFVSPIFTCFDDTVQWLKEQNFAGPDEMELVIHQYWVDDVEMTHKPGVKTVSTVDWYVGESE
jgi:hypothetical protein